MRIALLTTYLALGDDSDSGIGQHYRILADALAGRGQKVHVFYLCEPALVEQTRQSLAQLSPGWTCTVVTAPIPAIIGWAIRGNWPAKQLCGHLLLARAAAKALLKAHRRAPFDVVETHSYNLPAFFLLGAKTRPLVLTRVSTTLRQMLAIWSIRSRILGWEAALERRVAKKSDALVTHTRLHRDTVGAEENIPPERFALVPHGLPDPGTPRLPASRSGTVEFLYVGRFETRKGIDILLEAIPAVAAACPEVVFTLAGSHGETELWKRFAEAHPNLAGSRVRAPGRVSPAHLVELYQRCAVLVAPSRYESFGLIYVEAMSHARPVIGCLAGGIPEVVQDGVTGLLAAPGDTASLVACMTRLAKDGALREKLGEAARLDFLARFSSDALAANSLAHYQALLKANPPRVASPAV